MAEDASTETAQMEALYGLLPRPCCEGPGWARPLLALQPLQPRSTGTENLRQAGHRAWPGGRHARCHSQRADNPAPKRQPRGIQGMAALSVLTRAFTGRTHLSHTHSNVSVFSSFLTVNCYRVSVISLHHNAYVFTFNTK